MDYKIYCPSYKRSHKAISHRLFNPKTFAYVVRENEFDTYKKNFPNTEIIKIPDGMVLDIATTRNWILNNKTTKYVTMVDDDMAKITSSFDRKFRTLTAEQIDHVIQNGYIMAEDCGSGIWGMNVQSDPRFYAINRPLSFSLVVLGPFISILDQELRYDERLPLKEDYDLYLQSLNKSRKVLRFNYLNYWVDHAKMEGGCQTYRTEEYEQEQNILLRKKWGDLVAANWKHEGSINMIIKRPI